MCMGGKWAHVSQRKEYTIRRTCSPFTCKGTKGTLAIQKKDGPLRQKSGGPPRPFLQEWKRPWSTKKMGAIPSPIFFFSDNKEGGHCPPRVNRLLNLDMCMSPPPACTRAKGTYFIQEREGLSFPHHNGEVYHCRVLRGGLLPKQRDHNRHVHTKGRTQGICVPPLRLRGDAKSLPIQKMQTSSSFTSVKEDMVYE